MVGGLRNLKKNTRAARRSTVITGLAEPQRGDRKLQEVADGEPCRGCGQSRVTGVRNEFLRSTKRKTQERGRDDFHSHFSCKNGRACRKSHCCANSMNFYV